MEKIILISRNSIALCIIAMLAAFFYLNLKPSNFIHSSFEISDKVVSSINLHLSPEEIKIFRANLSSIDKIGKSLGINLQMRGETAKVDIDKTFFTGQVFVKGQLNEKTTSQSINYIFTGTIAIDTKSKNFTSPKELTGNTSIRFTENSVFIETRVFSPYFEKIRYDPRRWAIELAATKAQNLAINSFTSI